MCLMPAAETRHTSAQSTGRARYGLGAWGFRLAFDERFLDEYLGGDIGEFAPLPRLHLFAHGLEVALHSVDPDRNAINQLDHGFLRHGDTYVTINAPHLGSGRYGGTHAFGINNKREIVLFANDDHSFVLRHGRLTPLNDPKGVSATLLEGINDNGVIVGLWVDGNNVTHGLVFCDGVFTTHDDPHAGSADGLNAVGLTERVSDVG
jgi:hypothetical protein